MITHYDLFAGIGGFSLALEEVFTDEPIRHIFCEWEQFPTAVLRQHWPNAEFWGDIAELVTDTSRQRRTGQGDKTERQHGLSHRTLGGEKQSFTIVTGGFPCQPFSAAGRRKGTADDRYQWPNMFEVIRNTKPEWVIAENVRGLVTWSEGLVLETVCTDLESEGYEVQPFIIPAVAVGAPHRRDRVWIIGHAKHAGLNGTEDGQGATKRNDSHAAGADKPQQLERPDSLRQGHANPEHAPDSGSTRQHGQNIRNERTRRGKAVGTSQTSTASSSWDDAPKDGLSGLDKGQDTRSSLAHDGKATGSESEIRAYPDWDRNWQEVAFATCDDAVDDGLSRIVDGVPYSRAKWRKDSLKAYGNGIVHQVAIQIMLAIEAQPPALKRGEGEK